MEPLSPEEERQRGGLTRERLVVAALALVNEDGLEALSMRALADKLDVKAASLYWHVRDRRELLDLLAESVIESVRVTRGGPGWRENVLAASSALGRAIARQKDADRLLLETPEAVRRSDLFRGVAEQLQKAGLQPAQAADVAFMILASAIAGWTATDADAVVGSTSAVASIAIDSGSRGVILRAGSPDMQELIRVPPDQGGAAPAVIRGEQVVVRRLRGAGRGELELNPRRSWAFKVQAPTWNTVLDLNGLDVRGLHVDSGAANLECFLPKPRGVVPIHVSSGVFNVTMHRARGAAIVAKVHTGVFKLKLDDFSSDVAVLDLNWQSKEALGAPNRYELDLSSGVVDFKLDEYDPKPLRAVVASGDDGRAKPAAGKVASALEILLDGVEARVKSGGR